MRKKPARGVCYTPLTAWRGSATHAFFLPRDAVFVADLVSTMLAPRPFLGAERIASALTPMFPGTLFRVATTLDIISCVSVGSRAA
jgi:hypothetical protein